METCDRHALQLTLITMVIVALTCPGRMLMVVVVVGRATGTGGGHVRLCVRHICSVSGR